MKRIALLSVAFAATLTIGCRGDRGDRSYDDAGKRNEPAATGTAGEARSVLSRHGPFNRHTRKLEPMDDPRWEPGMPVLDRQPVGPGSAAQTAGTLPPRSVPETAPTPLQKHYVNLSAVGLEFI